LALDYNQDQYQFVAFGVKPFWSHFPIGDEQKRYKYKKYGLIVN
jgi:hypothetical protein